MNLKKLLLATVLLMGGILFANAQSNEKYDYAIVDYEYSLKKAILFFDDRPPEERKVDMSGGGGFNKTDLLKIIKEMNEKGWEVTNVNSTDATVRYFLRKKI